MSETRIELGKIAKATFGMGGYRDAMFGLSVMLEGQSWGAGDFKGFWSQSIEHNQNCKWTEDDRSKAYSDTCRFLDELLRKAKRKYVAELVGVPVEATFDGMRLVSWRVLEEVL